MLYLNANLLDLINTQLSMYVDIAKNILSLISHQTQSSKEPQKKQTDLEHIC